MKKKSQTKQNKNGKREREGTMKGTVKQIHTELGNVRWKMYLQYQLS